MSNVREFLEVEKGLDDAKNEVSAINSDIARDLVSEVIEAGVQKKVILKTAMNMMSDSEFFEFISEVTLQARTRNDKIVELLDRLDQAN
jgi:SRSO17 transposase